MTCFRITIHLILQTPNTYLLKNGSTTFNQGLSEVVNVFEAVICRFFEYAHGRPLPLLRFTKYLTGDEVTTYVSGNKASPTSYFLSTRYIECFFNFLNVLMSTLKKLL
jgi:hypothetical protein